MKKKKREIKMEKQRKVKVAANNDEELKKMDP